MRQYFLATLQDNVIISQRAASIGGHTTLNYLPGATFLGAVAKQLYRKLEPAEQRTLFHSGKVRFCDALPVSENGHAGYPVPLCWHYQKGEKKKERSILNHQHTDYRGKQPKQYRDEFFTRFGDLFIPASQLSLKTAVSADTGTAAAAQLFCYAALTKNSLFWGKLEADDESITQERFAELLGILQQGLRLGRSRSAEYGRVAIQLLDDEQVAKCNLVPPKPVASPAITFWLLSDAALQDEFGRPTLQPDAKAVGLPTHFTLAPMTKTYVRSRHYAPFNNARQRRELERQVLMAGSVLHFRSDTPLDAEYLHAIQEHGIGLYRQSGLGQVWINPDWLAKAEPSFIHHKSPQFRHRLDVSSEQLPTRPSEQDEISYNILCYLEQRKNLSSSEQTIEKSARQLAEKLESAYRSAQKFDPYLMGVCIGPSKSQWSRVMQAAQQTIQTKGSVQNLCDILFLEKNSICGEQDPQWSKKRIFLGAEQAEIDNFRKWFRKQFDDRINEPLFPKIIARFARLAMDVAEQKGYNDGKQQKEGQN